MYVLLVSNLIVFLVKIKNWIEILKLKLARAQAHQSADSVRTCDSHELRAISAIRSRRDTGLEVIGV